MVQVEVTDEEYQQELSESKMLRLIDDAVKLLNETDKVKKITIETTITTVVVRKEDNK